MKALRFAGACHFGYSIYGTRLQAWRGERLWRWVIEVFVLWLIAFESVAGQMYGWKTPATGHTTGRSALVLVIGCIFA